MGNLRNLLFLWIFIIMVNSSLITLVGEEIGDPSNASSKWSAFVDGKDGFLYGIPFHGHYVVKFNPVDKSMKSIGPDLGNQAWMCGVLANNGCIYCPPLLGSGRMLKINTVKSSVETFDVELQLPDIRRGSWMSGAIGPDDCVYYMPGSVETNHILQLDPDNDTLSSIDLPSWVYTRFIGTVLGNDDCIYGLPWSIPIRVMKFDPIEPQNISFFNEYGHIFSFFSDGVLGCDGNIYALNDERQILKVDTSRKKLTLIGDPLHEENNDNWGNPIIGVDQCIYWPRRMSKKVLNFDPVLQQPPLIVGPGDDNPCDQLTFGGWYGGALANDGVIYCVPWRANQVLAIDPLKEYSAIMKYNMKLHPEELGRLFVQNADEAHRESLFESALRKFGGETALRLLDECLPSDEDWAERTSNNLPLFAMAASREIGACADVPLALIYRLVRRNVHELHHFL